MGGPNSALLAESYNDWWSLAGVDALVGRKALVTRRVDVHGGRVRIGGEEWSARSYLDGEVLEEGATVDVVKIEGATALVTE